MIMMYEKADDSLISLYWVLKYLTAENDVFYHLNKNLVPASDRLK